MLEPCLEAFYPRKEGTILLCTILDPSNHFLLKVVLEEVWVDVELDRVVSRRDRFEIPLHIRVFLTLFNIVNVVDDEKSYKDGGTPYGKALFFAVC